MYQEERLINMGGDEPKLYNNLFKHSMDFTDILLGTYLPQPSIPNS